MAAWIVAYWSGTTRRVCLRSTGEGNGAGPRLHHWGVTVDDQEAAAAKVVQYGGEVLSAKGEGALKFRAPDGTIAEVVKPGRYNEK